MYDDIYRIIHNRWREARGTVAVDYFDRLYFYLLELEQNALEHLGCSIDPAILDRHSKLHEEITELVNRLPFNFYFACYYPIGPGDAEAAAAFAATQSERIKSEANRVRYELERLFDQTGCNREITGSVGTTSNKHL
jgi:hypothetical protein